MLSLDVEILGQCEPCAFGNVGQLKHKLHDSNVYTSDACSDQGRAKRSISLPCFQSNSNPIVDYVYPNLDEYKNTTILVGMQMYA